MPDQEVSDIGDPYLGAVALEDDAIGGGGGRAGGATGGGVVGNVRGWLDDEEGGNEPHHAAGTDETGAGSWKAGPTFGQPTHRSIRLT